MGKDPKYYFDEETLTYVRIDKKSNLILKVLIHLSMSICLGLVFFFLYLIFFDTPQEKKLKSENLFLKRNYELLQKKTESIIPVLKDLEQRDDNLYRAILQADPIPNKVRTEFLSDENNIYNAGGLSNEELIKNTSRQINVVSKMVYIQTKSYDELMDLVKGQEKRFLCIPAIQPVLNKDLKRVASGFGIRIDPVYHVKTFHEGLDFSAPVGTDVYVTGKGRVVYAGWVRGYGNVVEVDHGYQYETRYAHLSKIYVRVGQNVKRGEVIAAVGNTGKSTGPHLHYEVRFKGKPVNPVNYFFIDLSPEDYDKMVRISSNFGNIMD